MSQPYRHDLDALRERLAHLDAELLRIRAARAEADSLRAHEAAVAREAEELRRRVSETTAKRALPMLDRIAVASPCSASWDEMLGDERVRFCLACEKNVYNLSNMPREDAEALLAKSAGGEVCVRFYRRADGTVMTSDCPVGATKKRRKKMALAIAGAGAMAVAAISELTKPVCRGGVAGTAMGAVAVYTPTPSETVPTVMGTVAVPQPPPPVREHAVMGKMVARPQPGIPEAAPRD